MTESRSDTHDSHTGNIGIVADDLTGACDSGVEFLSSSTGVAVVVQPEAHMPAEMKESIVAYNTQSRRLPPEQAYTCVFRTTQRALSAGANLIFKKVDSALRGNFGEEIGAVMDAAEAAVAFILPAIPEAGRETIGGVQHINGVPIAETFYARDLEHRITESSVLRRAEEGGDRKAGLVPLNEVRCGRVIEAAAKLHKQGRRLIVVDARSTCDLRAAVQGLLRIPQPKVFVGCQGLAAALAAHLPQCGQPPRHLECQGGPVLCLCGTLHPRTRRQLQVAADSGRILLLQVMADRMADGTSAERLLNELEAACQGGLREGKTVALCFSGEPPSRPAAFSESVFRFFSAFSRRVVEHTRPSAVLLTGGETAYAVCRALGIEVVKLHARIAPLVVASRALGGPCHDMILITKGGSIGPDDLLCKIHDLLRGAE
jgi:uncharacterized protein YgbK (DUF1537 family)